MKILNYVLITLLITLTLPNIISATTTTWIPTTATHSVDGSVTSLVDTSDNTVSIVDHQEYIDVTSWDKTLSASATNINVLYKFELDVANPDFEVHIDILQPFSSTNVCVIDPNGVAGTYTCDLTAAGIDTPAELNALDVRLNGIENPDKKAPDKGDVDNIYLSITYTVNPIPNSVDVKTYTDASYTNEFKFFDETNTIYTQATVMNDDETPCTSCTVTANFIVDSSVEKSLTLNHVGSGVYKNSWTTTSTSTNGVYTVDVSASNTYGSSENTNNIHLYSGNNIAAYNMGYNSQDSNDYIMENKHMIIVYQALDPVSFIYQKDTAEKYYFNTIADSSTNGKAGIDSENLKGKISNPTLSQIGESLSSVNFNADISFSVNGDNEIIFYNSTLDSTEGWLNIIRYNESINNFDYLWQLHVLGGNVNDIEIGDVDNDGENEFLFGRGAITGSGNVSIYEYNSTSHSWYASTVLEFNRNARKIKIGDFDGDSDNEFLVGEDGNDDLWLYKYNSNTKNYDGSLIYNGTGQAWIVESGDLNNNNIPEIIFGSSNLNQIMVFEWNNTQSSYVNIASITTSHSGNDDASIGDLNMNSVDDLIVCGNGNVVDVISWNSVTKTYDVKWSTPNLGAYVQSCKIGDFNNDNYNDFWGGTISGYEAHVFEWDRSGWTFTDTWQDGDTGSTGMDTGFVGDYDNDGLEEFGIDGTSLRLYKDTGSSFAHTFTLGGLYGSAAEVGDLDNSGVAGGTGLKMNVFMLNEDVDYLEYEMYDIDTLGNTMLQSTISGSLGNNVADDRYHTQTGEDGLVTSLTSGQWTNYTNSDYSTIYDSSTASDSTNNLAISWVRFTETSGINFAKVGFWNDNSQGGLKISYDVSNAELSDNAKYLLAFTQGDYETIHAWISTIQDGTLPTPNFMAIPDTGAGTMTANVETPTSESDFDKNTVFEANASISCSDGDCGQVNVKLQYCEGVSCTDWTDITSNTAISSATTQKLCSDNLLNNTQCVVSWNDLVSDIGGTYRLNILATSNVSTSASDDTPNNVYINELQLEISQPTNNLNVDTDSNFTVSGIVSCVGLTCGSINVLAENNETDSWGINTVDLTVYGSNPNSCGVVTSSNPCNVEWVFSPGADGDYYVRISAGALVSEARKVIASTPDTTEPDVAINEPLNNSIVNSTITIKANASDAQSGINEVEYKIDSGSYNLMSPVGGFYQTDWDTTSQADGLHTITVRATDNSNNMNTDEITVNVSNPVEEEQQLSVLVETDKSTYTKKEWVYSTTTVIDELLNPVEGAVTDVTIYMPDMTVAKTCTNLLTDALGQVSCDYKTSPTPQSGTWNVTSTSSKTGYFTQEGSTTFTVGVSTSSK